MDSKKILLTDTSVCNKKNAECINALQIKERILPYCRTQEERWQEAFLNLISEDLNVQSKTIKKGIIKDIIEEPNKKRARELSEREFGKTAFLEPKGNIDIYQQYFSDIEDLSQFKISHQLLYVLLSRARSTIINWCNGKGIPRYREDVIKLAFWSKCTIEETNKLLECAGKHKLYVKGSGDSKENKNSLVDAVYIYMLCHQNYSFARAEKLIWETNSIVQKKIKAQNKSDVILLNNDPYSDSKNMEALLCEVENSDSDFLSFIREHIDSFIYDYQSLYDMLYIDFEKQYDINNKGVLEHRDSYTSSLNSLLGISSGPNRRWKNSLVKLIYSAIPQKIKPTQLMDTDFHTISRKDLIVLGMILNRDLAGMNMLLDTCKEPPIYGRGIGECIIWNALETGVELSVAEFPDKAKNLYELECIYTVLKRALEKKNYIREDENEISVKPQIIKYLNLQLSEYEALYYEHEYNISLGVTQYKRSREEINEDYIRKFPCCNALHSLQVFEWIKSTAVEMKLPVVMESLQDIFELYPEKQMFDYIVTFIAHEMEVKS